MKSKEEILRKLEYLYQYGYINRTEYINAIRRLYGNQATV